MIYSILTKTSHNNIRIEVTHVLPLAIKDMWRKIIVQHDNHNEFMDMRNKSTNFKLNIFVSPGKFRKTLNKHCFPEVECPLGCWQFIDYCKEIPFYYLLKKKFNFGPSNVHTSILNSARRDWPSTNSSLKWNIKPTTIISKEKGLCFLVCEDHSNTTLRSKFLHILTNYFIMHMK